VPPSADIITVTPNYRNAYTINANLQISRELTRHDALTVGYVHTAARELTYLRNMNLINPTGYLADGRPVYSSTQSAASRLFPQFNNITLQDVGAITDYNALVVHYEHRLSNGVDLNASYTWSHSISDAPDANSFEQNVLIEDNTSRLRDRGNSTVNRPQALTVSAVIAPQFASDNRFVKHLANNNQITFLANVSSGDQQNITANRNLTNDSKVTATRPLFIGRNTLRGPNIYQFDARYTRTFFNWEHFKPKFLAEFNNIFNAKNITSLNAVVPVDSLGVATLPTQFPRLSTVLEGRIVQFGVRLDW
jgi:hypothetical protein